MTRLLTRVFRPEAKRLVPAPAWLIVGLGNPGSAYAGTRHNLGYRVGEELATRLGGVFRAHKSGRADVVEGRLGPVGRPGTRLVVGRPRSYMNDSGGPVTALLAFYKVPVDQLVVVHDELDLPLGSLRVKCGGGDNGHNGLRSLRQSLGTGDFYRIRLGIGRPSGRQSAADFVLRPFSAAEEELLVSCSARAADAVESLVYHGLEITQSAFN